MISKKILSERLSKLEEKVNKLDPENVSAGLKKAVMDIEKFKKETKEALEKTLEKQTINISAELEKAFEKTVSEKIESLSNNIKGIVQKKGEEQDKKIEKFVSSAQKTVKIIWSQIADAIKGALEPILAEKGKDEGAKG